MFWGFIRGIERLEIHIAWARPFGAFIILFFFVFFFVRGLGGVYIESEEECVRAEPLEVDRKGLNVFRDVWGGGKTISGFFFLFFFSLTFPRIQLLQA